MNMQTRISDPSVSIQGLDLSFGAVEVLKDLNLDIAKGEFLVLLGASGCGKSTLLNCIAGLLDLSGGQIHINGKNVTWAEPSDRGIGMVFQSYALYPQMTVEGNLSFGLKNARVPKDEIRRRVARAAEILQIEPLLKRRPSALSGGQRQRVAIGRALVRDVDVFLFDEPLSNLDAKLRTDLRVELMQLHQKLGNTMVYVTHDQVEAMTLADRIAVMKGGKIMQLGTPEEVYHRPQNTFVADFIGAPSMNFLDGRLTGTQLQVAGATLDVSGYDFAHAPDAQPRKVTVGIRPEALRVNALGGRVQRLGQAQADLIEPMGADKLIWAKLNGAPLRLRLDGVAPVQPADLLDLHVDAASLSLFDASVGTRL